MIVIYLEFGFVFCLSGSRCLYSTKWYWPLFTCYIYIYYVHLSDFQSIFVDSDVLYIIHWFTHFSTNCFSWKFLSFFCLFFFSLKEKENFFLLLFSTTIKSSSHNFARSFFSTFWFISYDNTQQRKWQPRRHDIIEIRSIYVLWKKTGKKRQKWSVEKTLREQKNTQTCQTYTFAPIPRCIRSGRACMDSSAMWTFKISNIFRHIDVPVLVFSISFRNSTTIALCQRLRTGAFKYSFTQTQFLDF